jgi:flagellar hook protein FlgE
MDLSIPVNGMQQAEGAFNSSATSIMRAFQGSTTTGGSAPTSGDTVDLSTAVTGLVTSKQDFQANVKVAQVEDSLTKSLFSLLG